jgi:ferric-dicitrate binding protein FerR (iron transport regulator)
MGGPGGFVGQHGRAADHTTRALLHPEAKRAPQAAGGAQTSGSQQAGEVINAIPDEVVDRPGATSALPLKVSDAVYWQDVVRTLDEGRVRIRLLDDSFLNVGARSSMKIIQHDPGTQQTRIELTLGSLRGEVKKLTKRNGNFEIQTPTAVIGVVGTVLDVEASETDTRVHVLEGKVRVRNRDPKMKRQVIVHEGDETHIARRMPPAKPTHSPDYRKERLVAQEHHKLQLAENKLQQKEHKRQGRELQQVHPTTRRNNRSVMPHVQEAGMGKGSKHH